MSRTSHRLRSLAVDEDAAATVEYALLLLVATTIVVGLPWWGQVVSGLYRRTIAALP